MALELNYKSVVLGRRLFQEHSGHYSELGMTINKATKIERCILFEAEVKWEGVATGGVQARFNRF